MVKKSATAERPAGDAAELIAKTAYYKAEGRGFTPGQELADWLAAEREVAAMLKKASQKAVLKKKVAGKKKASKKKSTA